MFLGATFIRPIIILPPVLIGIIVLLRFNPEFRFKELVFFRIQSKQLKTDLMQVLIIAALMIISVLLFMPEYLFNLPRKNPLIMAAMCLFYPIFSAYPQEVIYRTFLFRRYKKLFQKKWLLIVASGVTFSFMHIVYYNPVSIILTLLAGLYLGYVYAKTQSVLYTAILHGILGILVFMTGLGHFFWLDMFEWI